jgi:hypothetical protein
MITLLERINGVEPLSEEERRDLVRYRNKTKFLKSVKAEN